MSQLNPFVAAILPAAQVQQAKSAERASHVRRAQELQKKAAHPAGGDSFEHQVESADAITEVKDEDPRKQKRGGHSRPTADEQTDETATDSKPGLDITG